MATRPSEFLAVQHYAARTHLGEPKRKCLPSYLIQVASAVERKRNEEALLRSEARYRSLIQSAVVGIFRPRSTPLPDVNPRSSPCWLSVG